MVKSIESGRMRKIRGRSIRIFLCLVCLMSVCFVFFLVFLVCVCNIVVSGVL